MCLNVLKIYMKGCFLFETFVMFKKSVRFHLKYMEILPKRPDLNSTVVYLPILTIMLEALQVLEPFSAPRYFVLENIRNTQSMKIVKKKQILKLFFRMKSLTASSEVT